MQPSQDKAAAIIQRCFRKYLRRKKNSKPEFSEKLIEVRSALEDFYQQASRNTNRYKNIEDLRSSINVSLRRLENIKTLTDLESADRNRKLPTEFLEEAKLKHQMKLEDYKKHWWEKLDLV